MWSVHNSRKLIMFIQTVIKFISSMQKTHLKNTANFASFSVSLWVLIYINFILQDWYILQSFITAHSSYKAVDFVLCKEGMCTFINSHTVEPPVILLQIVMVSSGTHHVKIHETLPITNESQLKKKKVLNRKCWGLYVTRQLIWMQTSKLFITVYWN